MKKINLLFCISLFFSSLQAQYVTDALKYSENFPAITARSLSMGGAFTSLGGDFASSMINPAGLGFYRKSELIFTPAISVSSTSADYMGRSSSDSRTLFNLGSFGYVGTYNSNKDKGLVSFSLALAYNRQQNFNNRSYIHGSNANSSLSDYFMANAEGTNPENLDPFYERLAFDTYIIDTTAGSPTSYTTPVFLPIDQRKTIETNRGIGNWSIAMGFNVSNILYLGMGVGIHQLQYDRVSIHSEFDNDPQFDFSQFAFREDLSVDGVGFDMDFGAIVRLFQFMRVGGSVHIPTNYKLHEHYYNTMSSEFKNGDSYFSNPTDINGDNLPEGSFEYKLNTPFKAQGGVSVQVGKMGIIAADVEYLDYGNMKLKENDYMTDFSTANDAIKQIYRPVVNLKLGGELRLDNFAVRLGGGYYPSPMENSGASNFTNTSSIVGDYTELTSGLGYRTEHFFVDFGFSWLNHDEKYNLYSAAGSDNVANLKTNEYRFLTTFGIRF
jgi:hypothetical protein